MKEKDDSVRRTARRNLLLTLRVVLCMLSEILQIALNPSVAKPPELRYAIRLPTGTLLLTKEQGQYVTLPVIIRIKTKAARVQNLMRLEPQYKFGNCSRDIGTFFTPTEISVFGKKTLSSGHSHCDF